MVFRQTYSVENIVFNNLKTIFIMQMNVVYEANNFINRKKMNLYGII